MSLGRTYRRLLCTAVCTAAFLFSAPYSAAEINVTQTTDSPVIIEADALSYVPEQKLVMALGNVTITQDKRILMAQELMYDQETSIVTAQGDVSLMEPNGHVYFAKAVELKDDLKKGVINHFRARFADGSLLAANKALRESETITKLEQAVYSPCPLCDKGKSIFPLWQIKANKVKLDDTKERVYYHDATLEVKGVPIAYTPVFSHPSPEASRKSGFLRPTYSSIGTLGATAKIPYYINIAPQMDATITPFITSQEGVVMSGEFRHLTQNGEYELEGSITNPKQRDALGNEVPGRDIRGHIEGRGNFSLENDWGWGFNGKRASDDTYLRRYKFGNEDLLTSRAYIQQIKDRNYFGTEAITFQGLNAEDNPDTTPLILPLATLHRETEPGWNGSRFMLDSSALALYRDQGVQSRRLSTSGGWKVPFVTSGGQLLEFKASVRADGYDVSDVPDPTNPLGTQDGLTGRMIPEVQANWSFPLVKYNQNSQLFLEPVANIILSPHGGNPGKIPNEDSQELELSDVNIFSSNHFTGLDRVEGGPRTNYGFRGGLQRNSGGQVNFLLGQTYRLKEDENFTQESGLSKYFSDYVGRVSVSDGKIAEVSYRFRADSEDFLLNRSEIDAVLNLDPIKLNAGYVMLNENIPGRPDLDREELTNSLAYHFTEYWHFVASSRRDMSDNGGLISAGSGLVFIHPCLNASFLLNREFTRDRDLQPSTSFIFEIGFKNLN
ncbi:MAG: LPS-assembly protein LptD [Proteobacteria bacterium]|nr:LPS-assembly protein LptD [Pseudomonadota bacterium]